MRNKKSLIFLSNAKQYIIIQEESQPFSSILFPLSLGFPRASPFVQRRVIFSVRRSGSSSSKASDAAAVRQLLRFGDLPGENRRKKERKSIERGTIEYNTKSTLCPCFIDLTQVTL